MLVVVCFVAEKMLSFRVASRQLIATRWFATEASVASVSTPIKKVGSSKAKGNRPCINKQKERNAALEKLAEEKKLSWRLVAATLVNVYILVFGIFIAKVISHLLMLYRILHRYPVITRDFYKWEEDMYKIQESNEDRRREVYIVFTPFHLF